MHRHIFITASITFFLGACGINPIVLQPSTAHSSSSSVQSHSMQSNSTAPFEQIIKQATGASLQEELFSGGVLEIGSASAPVSMLLFTNYSCGYCQDFQNQLMPDLLTHYVSVGKVRLGIVPIPMQKYPQSDSTAALMLCSAEQKKGRLMNSLLFTELDPKKLQKAINLLGLNMQNFKTCMESDELKLMLLAEQRYQQIYAVTLAPSYVINNKPFTGLPEWSDLRGQLEEALRN